MRPIAYLTPGEMMYGRGPHIAYLVEYIDARGRVLRRGIFSEASPSIASDLGAVQTREVHRLTSRRSFGHAAACLRYHCRANGIALS